MPFTHVHVSVEIECPSAFNELTHIYTLMRYVALYVALMRWWTVHEGGSAVDSRLPGDVVYTLLVSSIDCVMGWHLIVPIVRVLYISNKRWASPADQRLVLGRGKGGEGVGWSWKVVAVYTSEQGYQEQVSASPSGHDPANTFTLVTSQWRHNTAHCGMQSCHA